MYSATASRTLHATTIACLALTYSVKTYGQTTTHQYHEHELSAEAFPQCSLCGGERYGALFYEFQDSGLKSTDFPLILENIQLAFGTTEMNGMDCHHDLTPSRQFIELDVDVYAGQTAPTSVEGLPASGPWPGEMVVTSTRAWVERSPRQFLIRNYIRVSETIFAPYRYIRVVVNVPTGQTQRPFHCQQAAAISPFMDGNGVAADHRNLFYDSQNQDWTWAEDFRLLGEGFTGDWFLRIDVTPMNPSSPDAGIISPIDAGTSPIDAGVAPDAGSSIPILVVEQVSPNNLLEGEEGIISVTGTGFQSNVTLHLNDVELPVQVIHNQTTIVATVPFDVPLGTYDVIVRTPDGQTARLHDGFQVYASLPADHGCDCAADRSVSGSATAGFWLMLLGGFGYRRWRRMRR